VVAASDMNGLRGHGLVNQVNEVKYPANCATRIGGNVGSGGEVMISSASTGIPPEGLISAHDLNLIEKLYEPKANKKLLRVLTVIGYCFCVSLIAILLSLYYLFIWNPYNKGITQKQQHQQQQQHLHRVAAALMPTVASSLRLKPAALGTTKSHKVLSLTSPLLETEWRSPLERPAAAAADGAQSNSQLLSSDEDVLVMTAAENSRLEDPFTLYAKAKRAREREKRDKLFHTVQGATTSPT